MGVKPAKPGWGIPPPRGLLLGGWQPEGHCLPQHKMLDLVIAVAFLHDAPEGPPTGPNLLPPVVVVGAKPGHLYQDPPAGVVD